MELNNACVCVQTPYIHFMRMLFAATSSHPMVVLEFRHVSMRLCLRAGQVDHAAHAVAAIVQKLGFKEACVVGHSFGTFVASRLCQLHPGLVQSLVGSCVLLAVLLLIHPHCLVQLFEWVLLMQLCSAGDRASKQGCQEGAFAVPLA